MSSSFDDRAATWDEDPQTVTRARQVADAIRAATALTPDLRVLEYGAGTGLLSQHLHHEVGPITVTDPSAGMRAVVAEKIASGSLAGATVADLDLTRDEVPPGRYDLIVTMMALHHVADVPRVLAAFAELLVPGGTVCIADLDAEDGSFHAAAGSDHPPGHHHDGFEHDQLAGWLGAAGFGPARFTPAFELERHGRTYGVFLATARRRDERRPD